MKTKNVLLFAIVFSPITACLINKASPLKEIVKFRNGDISLEGALALPEGGTKFPLAIFIHGSGMTTRNDYEDFVDPLIREGIAVFRYDKRGVGASGGLYNDVNAESSEYVFSLLASDAAAAITYFKNDKRIDSTKIILIGGSQAGWIIPEINTLADVWLSVCVSGPTVSVGEEIYYSELAENRLYTQAQADQIFKSFKGSKGYSPISRIEKMKSPSLWIFGGKDISIPIQRSIELLDSIKSVREIAIEMKYYPDADHALYNNKKQRREPYVKVIIAWINSHR